MDSTAENTSLIRQKSAELGFDACGIAPAGFLEESAGRLERWLNEGRQGSMEYMNRHFEKRLDPRLLVEGAQSVIVLLSNYFPARMMPSDSPYLISAYAYGEDYHEVIREKLTLLSESLQKKIPGITLRSFVDSAPVLERAWATRAGLGWIGKNSMLITRHNGSFFFISELITDLPLVYDEPMHRDFCGNCNRCMDACPTGAITEARVVDARKCISYLTIENKDEIPAEFKDKYKQWIFGCDICQLACPWNRFSTPHSEPSFAPSPDLGNMTQVQWDSLDKDSFNQLFRNSPVKRAKFEGLKRNIAFLDSK